MDRIIENNSILSIEQHLVYIFINKFNLNYKASDFLNSLVNFKINQNLLELLSELEIDNIKSLEKYMEILIPTNDRKLNGAFFTPQDIVDYIINEVKPKKDDKCLDPSCGCGAFLIGLVEYYTNNYQKSIKEVIKENIYGFDILKYNIKRSKIILTLYALLHNEILQEEDFNLICHNSLNYKIDTKFDLIIGNPPYIKFQDMDIETRNLLLKNYKTTKKGAFNTYFAFFELGYKLLNKNGKMGYITPNNYFTSLAAVSLREYFFKNRAIYKIIDFKDIKVFDAQTYTAITFINKSINNTILFDKISQTKNYSDFLTQLNFSDNKVDDLNSKKWRLLKSKEQNNIKIIENIGTPIIELFDISAGIATLKDEVYFIDSSTLENGYYKKEMNNIIYLIEEEITKPVYKISNFKTQDSIRTNSSKIICPYIINEMGYEAILEEDFIFKYPKCYEYLSSQKEVLKNRDKGKTPLNPFYLWGRTQGIAKRGRKILNPTFSKHPRFLTVLEEDAYYTNGYGIFFNQNKKKSQSLFNEDINPFSKEKNIFIVQKILNSIIMDYYITATSVSIQGGFPCYQKNFIERFTIPIFSNEEMRILNNLTDKEEIDDFLVDKYQLKLDN